jgi:hypothetical protein
MATIAVVGGILLGMIEGSKIPISKKKYLAQQSCFQKVWKILFFFLIF